MEPQFCDEPQKNKERKITKVIILREEFLRWILDICRRGIDYEQLKLVMDYAKLKVVKCWYRQPEGWNSYDNLTVLIVSLT